MNRTPELSLGDIIRHISKYLENDLFKRCYQVFGYSSHVIKGSNSSPEAVVCLLWAIKWGRSNAMGGPDPPLKGVGASCLLLCSPECLCNICYPEARMLQESLWEVCGKLCREWARETLQSNSLRLQKSRNKDVPSLLCPDQIFDPENPEL